MRRKGRPNVLRLGSLRDVRRELKPELLAGIGAVCITWNLIEDSIDMAVTTALDITFLLRVDITSRIHGLDGKLAIIRKALQTYPIFAALNKDVIRETLSAIETHKRYRDGVIHARIIDPDDPVAETPKGRGATDEVLVTQQSLDALYARLRLLKEETSAVAFLIHLSRLRQAAIDDRGIELAELQSQDTTARLRNYQQSRLSLPPLPPFPEEQIVKWAEDGAPPG